MGATGLFIVRPVCSHSWFPVWNKGGGEWLMVVMCLTIFIVLICVQITCWSPCIHFYLCVCFKIIRSEKNTSWSHHSTTYTSPIQLISVLVHFHTHFRSTVPRSANLPFRIYPRVLVMVPCWYKVCWSIPWWFKLWWCVDINRGLWLSIDDLGNNKQTSRYTWFDCQWLGSDGSGLDDGSWLKLGSDWQQRQWLMHGSCLTINRRQTSEQERATGDQQHQNKVPDSLSLCLCWFVWLYCWSWCVFVGNMDMENKENQKQHLEGTRKNQINSTQLATINQNQSILQHGKPLFVVAT